MKAVILREFGDPQVLEMAELEDPRPGAGEVVVRLVSTSVNRIDTLIRRGEALALISWGCPSVFKY